MGCGRRDRRGRWTVIAKAHSFRRWPEAISRRVGSRLIVQACGLIASDRDVGSSL